MIRLTDDASLPKTEDAAERHMHLCSQTPNAGKYVGLIKPFYDDFEDKWNLYRKAVKNSTFASDLVKLKNSLLGDVLRDTMGRAKEFDRNQPGSRTESLLFPKGLSAVVTMPDKDEPVAAGTISQKLVSLGTVHILYPFAATIDEAIAECNASLKNQLEIKKAESNVWTALVISKLKLIKQYNQNYFVAAGDFDKGYAEKLFPHLRPPKNGDTEIK